MEYQKLPILEAARRCGLVLDQRTIHMEEVEASCPFCGDHGKGKYHLSLNTQRDQYRCNLCGSSGNSVTLYARLNGLTNKDAYLELAAKSNIYKLPLQPDSPNTTSREPYGLNERYAAYTEMLSLLTLFPRHRQNLHERGLPDSVIAQNGYKSMPETEAERQRIAALLSRTHELHGLPGFYTKNGIWTMAGPRGFLIPVRNKDGLIQGLKIRLDDTSRRKYCWLSTRRDCYENGTRSHSWIHVTGDRTQKRAYLTEGPLKGDVASYLAGNALFVCLGGVSARKGLCETLRALGVQEVMEAVDMDQFTKPEVQRAVCALRSEVQKIPGIRYYQCTWDKQFKGVDDCLFDWTKRKIA